MMGTAPKDIDYLSTTWFIACRAGNLSLVVTLLFSGDHFSNLSYLLNLQDPEPNSTLLLHDDPDLANEITTCFGSSFAGMTGLHVALAACFGKQHDPEPFANRTTEKMFELRKRLVLQLIEVSSHSTLEITFGNGNTALHLATLLGERDIVQALLRKGVLSSVENDMKLTPFQLARGEHADSIRDLIRSAEYTTTSSSSMPSSPPSSPALPRQVHTTRPTNTSVGSPESTTSTSTTTTVGSVNSLHINSFHSNTSSRLISSKRALETSPDKNVPSASISRHDISAPESAPKSVRLTPEDAKDDRDGGKNEDEEEMMADEHGGEEQVQRTDVKSFAGTHISAQASPSNFHQRALLNNASNTSGSKESSPLSPSSSTSQQTTGGNLSPFHRLSISGQQQQQQKSLSSPPSPSLLRFPSRIVQVQQDLNEMDSKSVGDGKYGFE